MTNYYYYFYYSFISDTSSKNKQHEARSIADPGAPGGIPEPCPPKRKLCPPKRGLFPEEINRIGATGVQIEAQIGVFCGLTTDFLTFLG